ncbi:MAG: HAD family phosphatase [Lentimicrobiaceae bacterium]|jgi:putative hydrolase of the HAD superfamily
MPVIQSSKIKNLIFDLGGVLLNINPLLSLLELEKISGISKDELIVKFVSEKIFEKFDTGSLNPAQFRSKLCQILNCSVSDSEIDRTWNELLLDFPLPRVELLQQLRKNYRVFLLSNTNSIHFDHYTHEFYEKYGIRMADLFDKLFLSYEIGIHKPDAGIYTYVLQHAHINPSESVFIDDSLPNIEAAFRQGITGIHIQTGDDVTHFFENGFLRKNLSQD